MKAGLKTAYFALIVCSALPTLSVAAPLADHPSQTVRFMDGEVVQALRATVALHRPGRFNRDRVWKRDGEVFRIPRTPSDGDAILTSRLVNYLESANGKEEVLVFRRVSGEPQAFLKS